MRRILLGGCVVAGLLVSAALGSRATVEYAKKEKTNCTTCHVKTGSKELTAAGRYYAQHKTLAGFPPQAPKAPEKPAPPAKPAPAAPPAKPVPPAAPAPSARQLYLIIREQPYPEKQPAYEQMLKEWVAAAKEVKLSEEFAWEVVQRGPLNYSLIIPIQDLAVLDPMSESGQARHKKMMAALGEQRFQEMVARAHGTFATAELLVVESVPELSCRPASAEESAAKPPRFVHVDVTRVRLDRSDAYLAVMKQFFEIGRRAGCPFAATTYRTLTGPANTYFIVIEAADWNALAELHRFLEEDFPKAAESPEAWQKLDAEWNTCLVSFEHYDETVRYDLSYRPEPLVEKPKP